MNGLTGSRIPDDWRTTELLRVGDDLRHQREADAQRAQPDATRHGLRGWVGRHMVVVGRSVAGEPARKRPCPELPNGSHTTAA
jgi:hypothetical protein